MKRTMALMTAGALTLVGFAGCERAEDANANRGGIPRNNQSGTGTPSGSAESRSNTTVVTPGSGVNGSTTDNDLNVAVHTQQVTAWKTQISDLRGRVDQMKTRIDSFEGTNKEEIKDQYTTLQTEVVALEQQVNDHKQTDTSGFDQLRSDVESSMSRINEQMRDLEQKLNQPAATQPQQPQQPAETPDLPEPETPDTPTMPDTTSPSNPTNPG